MIIDKEFESLISPLSEDEYSQLKKNLIEDGCREPLVIWGETIIDGHNRYKICTEEHIEYSTVGKDFKSRDDVIHWIILNQFGRRNLTPFQRAELALKLKPILAEQAKEKQGARTDLQPNFSDKLPKSEKKDTREELGKVAGVSGKTINRVENILTKGTKEDIEQVRSGKVSISKKEKEIKQRDAPEDAPKKEGRDLKVVYEG